MRFVLHLQKQVRGSRFIMRQVTESEESGSAGKPNDFLFYLELIFEYDFN